MADKKEKQAKPVKRGRILIKSIFYEALVFVGMYLSLKHLPALLEKYTYLEVSAGWKIGITVVGIMLGLLIGFIQIYFRWAPNNLFFTFIPEGRAKIVVRGDAFKKALIRWEGHDLARTKAENMDVWDVIERPSKKRFFGGLKFYGLWPIEDIYIYDFSWTGVGENGETQRHIKETIDHIVVKDDVYWCSVEKCEDKELLPLDVEALLTIRVINPYKALFAVQSWLETVVNRTKPLIRNEITKDTYEKLTSSEKAIGDAIWKGSRALRKEFQNRYGIELRKLEVKEIDPPKDLRETTLRRFVAQKAKEAAIVEAEGEAKRIRTVNEAIKEFGDLGQLRTVLDTLEKSPEKGAKWIIPLPGMIDFFTRVFPEKEPSGLGPDDIAALRKIIEKLQQDEAKKKVS